MSRLPIGRIRVVAIQAATRDRRKHIPYVAEVVSRQARAAVADWKNVEKATPAQVAKLLLLYRDEYLGRLDTLARRELVEPKYRRLGEWRRREGLIP